jgi:spore coat protein U-like protein
MFTWKTDARMLSLTAAAVALAISASTGADAATTQKDIAVSARVVAACTLTTNALDFGAYDPLGTNATQDLANSADISVTCTNNAGTTISLSSGAHALGSPATTRQLADADGTHFLAYSLYTDVAHGTAWGDGTLAPTFAYTGTGAATTLTVYGKVEKGQAATAGNYTDTVTATISF